MNAETVAQKKRGAAFEVTPDVFCLQDKIVNLYFVGLPGAKNWTLVDTGLWRGVAHQRDG